MFKRRPNINARREAGFLILTLRGSFADAADKVIHTAFQQLDLAGLSGLIVNVNDARFWGNHTVGEFFGRLMQLRNHTQVRLVAMLGGPKASQHHWWLTIFKLDQVFEVYESEAQAIAGRRKGDE